MAFKSIQRSEQNEGDVVRLEFLADFTALNKEMEGFTKSMEATKKRIDLGDNVEANTKKYNQALRSFREFKKKQAEITEEYSNRISDINPRMVLNRRARNAQELQEDLKITKEEYRKKLTLIEKGEKSLSKAKIDLAKAQQGADKTKTKNAQENLVATRANLTELREELKLINYITLAEEKRRSTVRTVANSRQNTTVAKFDSIRDTTPSKTARQDKLKDLQTELTLQQKLFDLNITKVKKGTNVKRDTDASLEALNKQKKIEQEIFLLNEKLYGKKEAIRLQAESLVKIQKQQVSFNNENERAQRKRLQDAINEQKIKKQSLDAQVEKLSQINSMTIGVGKEVEDEVQASIKLNNIKEEILDTTTKLKHQEAEILKLQKGLGQSQVGGVFNKGTEGKYESRIKRIGNAQELFHKKSARANLAAMSFIQTVQDSPYGMLGMANNIQMMATSFTYLHRDTNSATGSLKAFMSSLFKGPMLFSLIITLVTILLQYSDKLEEVWGNITRWWEGGKRSLEDLNSIMKEMETSEFKNIMATKDFYELNKVIKDLDKTVTNFGAIDNFSNWLTGVSDINELNIYSKLFDSDQIKQMYDDALETLANYKSKEQMRLLNINLFPDKPELVKQFDTFSKDLESVTDKFFENFKMFGDPSVELGDLVSARMQLNELNKEINPLLQEQDYFLGSGISEFISDVTIQPLMVTLGHFGENARRRDGLETAKGAGSAAGINAYNESFDPYFARQEEIVEKLEGGADNWFIKLNKFLARRNLSAVVGLALNNRKLGNTIGNNTFKTNYGEDGLLSRRDKLRKEISELLPKYTEKLEQYKLSLGGMLPELNKAVVAHERYIQTLKRETEEKVKQRKFSERFYATDIEREEFAYNNQLDTFQQRKVDSTSNASNVESIIKSVIDGVGGLEGQLNILNGVEQQYNLQQMSQNFKSNGFQNAFGQGGLFQLESQKINELLEGNSETEQNVAKFLERNKGNNLDETLFNARSEQDGVGLAVHEQSFLALLIQRKQYAEELLQIDVDRESYMKNYNVLQARRIQLLEDDLTLQNKQSSESTTLQNARFDEKFRLSQDGDFSDQDKTDLEQFMIQQKKKFFSGITDMETLVGMDLLSIFQNEANSGSQWSEYLIVLKQVEQLEGEIQEHKTNGISEDDEIIIKKQEQILLLKQQLGYKKKMFLVDEANRGKDKDKDGAIRKRFHFNYLPPRQTRQIRFGGFGGGLDDDDNLVEGRFPFNIPNMFHFGNRRQLTGVERLQQQRDRDTQKYNSNLSFLDEQIANKGGQYDKPQIDKFEADKARLTEDYQQSTAFLFGEGRDGKTDDNEKLDATYQDRIDKAQFFNDQIQNIMSGMSSFMQDSFQLDFDETKEHYLKMGLSEEDALTKTRERKRKQFQQMKRWMVAEVWTNALTASTMAFMNAFTYGAEHPILSMGVAVASSASIIANAVAQTRKINAMKMESGGDNSSPSATYIQGNPTTDQGRTDNYNLGSLGTNGTQNAINNLANQQQQTINLIIGDAESAQIVNVGNREIQTTIG